MMTTSSQMNSSLYSKVAGKDQPEDNRSTSASGSENEAEGKRGPICFTSSEEDIPSATEGESESEAALLDKTVSTELPAQQHFSLQDISNMKAELGLLQSLAKHVFGSMYCTKRASPVEAKQVSTEYNRDLLLQMRNPKAQGDVVLPHTVSSRDVFEAQAAVPASTAHDQLNQPPGLLLPPGLCLPPGFEPPPGFEKSAKGKQPGAKSLGKPRKELQGKASGQMRAEAPAFVPGGSTGVAASTAEQAPTKNTFAAKPKAVTAPKQFDAVSFRKELVIILRELSSDWNVGVAVQRVRDEQVPKDQQAAQVVDIVTRAADERRGVIRRLSFAFVAGLARAEASAFDRTECLAGLKIFFEEVYFDLCDEVPRLRSIIANEFLPTLRTVFPAKELIELLPAELRTA